MAARSDSQFSVIDGHKRSKHEVALDEHLNIGGLLDGSIAEYTFDDARGWRFDRAWPALRIACEVDGGNRMAVISKRTGKPVAIGRHTLAADYSKLNAATQAGWRVFRFLPEMIESGEAFGTMQDALTPLPFSP